MFDPSNQLHNYFIGQGYSELEAYRESAKVSGRCPVTPRLNTNASQPRNAAVRQHMPEETDTTQDSEIIDLGFSVSEADVARPVLRAGTYNAVIAFARQDQTLKGQPRLLVGYRLTEPARDITGKDINPGFTVVQRILRQPTGNLTESMIQDRLKRIHFAAAGPGRVTTSEWIGKPVRVRVTLREQHRDEQTGEEYDASNEVGGVYPPAKAA